MIYKDHTKISWRDFDLQKKLDSFYFWRWHQKIDHCILIYSYIPDHHSPTWNPDYERSKKIEIFRKKAGGFESWAFAQMKVSRYPMDPS